MVKAGILGGGQLGRMLLQQAANYPVLTYILENDHECPAAHLCHHFQLGDIRDFYDVYEFGKMVDVLTIEIESVNIDALDKLVQEGVRVFPDPAILRMIKNKRSQKEFYQQHGHPTAPFRLIETAAELALHEDFLPFAQKLAEGGYDGKGVQLMFDAENFQEGFNAPSLIEKLVDVNKEIAVIVAIDQQGEYAVFPAVEMVFDPALNLLDYQVSPAMIDENLLSRAGTVALNVAKSFNSPGLFAIELFVDKSGEILVNETAPRVHNSGHHSIEANYCSQYDMLWRVMLGYKLGNTDAIKNSALVNLIGEKDHSGDTLYEGLNEVLAMANTYLHLYGKKETRPGRKMGHVTLLGDERAELLERARQVKQTLKVISSSENR